MCGRYATSSRPGELVDEFEIDDDRSAEPTRSILAAPQSPPVGEPDYNVAPTKAAPVVLTRVPRPIEGATGRDGYAERPAAARQLRMLTWGLVPSWAKDVKVGLRMTNARAETLLDKPSFARVAAARRCLVPADGWYEWQASPTATDAKGRPRRQPFFIHRSDGAPLAMAGLYEFWRDTSVADQADPAAWLTTYTVITTAAEPGLDRIHDRQPLVLEREGWAQWLDPGETDPAVVKSHLEFAAPGRFDAYPVSMAVNSSRNNGAQLLQPAGESDLVGVVDPTTGEIVGS